MSKVDEFFEGRDEWRKVSTHLVFKFTVEVEQRCHVLNDDGFMNLAWKRAIHKIHIDEVDRMVEEEVDIMWAIWDFTRRSPDSMMDLPMDKIEEVAREIMLYKPFEEK